MANGGDRGAHFSTDPISLQEPVRPSDLRSLGDCGQQWRGVRTLASALAFEDGGVAQDGREAGGREGVREPRWRPPFLGARRGNGRTRTREPGAAGEAEAPSLGSG